MAKKKEKKATQHNGRKLILAAGAALMALSVVGVHAEGETGEEEVFEVDMNEPPIADEATDTEANTDPTIITDGKIELNYFDDVDSSIPVVGAEFTVYKVAEIGTVVYEEQPASKSVEAENSAEGTVITITESDAVLSTDGTEVTIDSEQIRSLVKDENGETVEINGSTTPEDLLVYDLSELSIGTYTTNERGLLDITGLGEGVYLGIESTPARYHLSTDPWLISLPFNSDGTSNSMTAVVNPKAQLAGDLQVKKVVENEKSHDEFHVTVELTDESGNKLEDTFKCKLPNGSEATYASGDSVAIHGAESLYIYDIPEGTKYVVTEVEADKNSYKTRYDNEVSAIEAKAEVTTTITNTFDDSNTGVGGTIIPFACMAAGAGLLIIVLIARKKEKKTGESN